MSIHIFIPLNTINNDTSINETHVMIESSRLDDFLKKCL